MLVAFTIHKLHRMAHVHNMLEVDEHAHETYDAVCELTRMQQVSWGAHGGDNLEAH